MPKVGAISNPVILAPARRNWDAAGVVIGAGTY
jgi:hypothetical protein